MEYTRNRLEKNITVTVNGNVINLPSSVIIPFWDKFKIRQMI